MAQNVVCITSHAVKQPFVSGSAQFFKRTEIRGGGTATYERFYTLSVGLIGERPPGAGGILQFAECR